MTLSLQLSQLLLAQSTAAPASGPMDGVITFIGPLLMFGVIYMLLIRPASKQRKAHANLLTALKKDDEIVTTGGICGKIVSIDEKIATIEVADKVKLRVLRDRIAGRYDGGQASAQK